MARNYEFSFSKIDVYDTCPFKYLLQYVEKHFVNAKSLALELGTLIHGIEEDIANYIKDGKPIDYIALKNKVLLGAIKLEHSYPKDFNEEDKSGRSCKQKIYEYLQSEIYRLEKYMKEHPTYEIVGAEVNFTVPIHDRMFGGKIDRVIRDTATGNYICHDIKTFAVPKEEEELKTPLQFVVYVEAMKKLYGILGEQVTCGYDLPFCDTVQEAGTNGYLNRGIKKLSNLIDKIDSKEYKPCPSALCNYCPYCMTNPDAPNDVKMLCPYFSVWNRETRRKEDIQIHENEWMGMDNHALVMESFLKKHSK